MFWLAPAILALFSTWLRAGGRRAHEAEGEAVAPRMRNGTEPLGVVSKRSKIPRSTSHTLLAYPLTHSILYLMYLLTHLLTYSLTYLLTYLPTHLLTYLLTYFLTYSLTHLLTYLLTYLLTHLLTWAWST